MPATTRGRKGEHAKRGRPARKSKIPAASLHGQGVQVSVDERLDDLVRRFPALQPAFSTLLQEGKKRIRDFPPPDQGRLLRMVFALKKAVGH